MVSIHLAVTLPINPPGATPILTRSQVWAGLTRKARRPQDFVAVVDTCEILFETGDSITCTVTFKPGVAHARKIKEVCTLRAPCRLDYEIEDGSTAVNVISDGPSRQEDDLFLTFAFGWKHPELLEGSDETKRVEENHWKVGLKFPVICTHGGAMLSNKLLGSWNGC